jgi:hypothetical protein
LEIAGSWDQSSPEAARLVAEKIREACLAGFALRSDRQPARLRLEHRAVSYPAIWLHDEDPGLAWLLVVIGPSDWCQLAYEFGHELGHVLCNSWDRQAVPHPPCAWLEESLVEAFTLRGLARLEQGWASAPPFAGDHAFADEIARYRQYHLKRKTAQVPAGGVGAWFRGARARLEAQGGEASDEAPMTLGILKALERHETWVEDLGALNRWPERSAAPLDDYLAHWRTSCAEIGTPGGLPRAVARLLGIRQG